MKSSLRKFIVSCVKNHPDRELDSLWQVIRLAPESINVEMFVWPKFQLAKKHDITNKHQQSFQSFIYYL